VGIVRGRVTFQGQALAGGLVVFTPHLERGQRGQPLIADVDSSGEFKLRVEGSPYIAAGWYRVAIAEPPTWTTPTPNVSAPQLSFVSPFPDTLRRPDLSGLEREVVAGRENEFEFHIEMSR
jgi:hypothetical protein